MLRKKRVAMTEVGQEDLRLQLHLAPRKKRLMVANRGEEEGGMETNMERLAWKCISAPSEV
jgi:hypothetical protein